MRNPVQIIESVKTVVQIAIAWLVLMGFWPMSNEQQLLTVSFGIAIVNLLGTLWETQQTTPLAAPQAPDGTPLVRGMPGTATRSALKE
jgi:hypothetical protein